METKQLEKLQQIADELSRINKNFELMLQCMQDAKNSLIINGDIKIGSNKTFNTEE